MRLSSKRVVVVDIKDEPSQDDSRTVEMPNNPKSLLPNAAPVVPASAPLKGRVRQSARRTSLLHDELECALFSKVF